MRCLITILLLLIAMSCEDADPPKGSVMLDEVSLGLMEAWSESISKNYVPSFYNSIGDTLIIYEEIHLFKATTGTLIPSYPDCPQCYIKLPSRTKLVITGINGHIVDLKTTGEPIAEGFFFKEDLLEVTSPGIDQQRKRLLNYFERKREELKVHIMSKYGLTEDGFYRTVGSEYSKRTGNPGFSF